MASHNDSESGNGIKCDLSLQSVTKTLLSLSDDVLIITLLHLKVEERINVERTSKRLKSLIDKIFSLQKVFAFKPIKTASMKKWSPLDKMAILTKSSAHLDTLSSCQGPSRGSSILFRCPSVRLVNLRGISVDGSQLAKYCPSITHLIVGQNFKARDYVNQLIEDKKDVLIEALESDCCDPDTDFSFLSLCPRLRTLNCPRKQYDIPAHVLSQVENLAIYILNEEKMNALIGSSSKNVTHLHIRNGSSENRVQNIVRGFPNLKHVHTYITVEDFALLKEAKHLESIKADSACITNDNINNIERYLSTNGSKLKYLWIKKCDEKVLNRFLTSVATNCPQLVCVKIKKGISIKDIDLDTIKRLPQTLERINLDINGFSSSNVDIDKLKELLTRCKSSLRKVTLTNSAIQRFAIYGDLVSGPEEELEKVNQVEQLNEIIRILTDHERIKVSGKATGNDVGATAKRGKGLRWIEINRKKWDGKSIIDQFRGKMSFFY